VDLGKLSERAEEFFKNKGFQTLVEHSKDACKIVASLRVGDKVRSCYVTISGGSNDFMVDFVGGSGGRLSLLMSAQLVTLFGGGVFWLDRLRAQEFYEKLERDFWIFAEHAVEKGGLS
jgi:hypothetical protein